jgi:hypothetical protein
MTTYRQLHEQKLILDIAFKGLWSRFLEHCGRFSRLFGKIFGMRGPGRLTNLSLIEPRLGCYILLP